MQDRAATPSDKITTVWYAGLPFEEYFDYIRHFISGSRGSATIEPQVNGWVNKLPYDRYAEMLAQCQAPTIERILRDISECGLGEDQLKSISQHVLTTMGCAIRMQRGQIQQLKVGDVPPYTDWKEYIEARERELVAILEIIDSLRNVEP